MSMYHRFLPLAFLITPFIMSAQEPGKADALVHPKIVEQSITVGGARADVPGFNNLSIQMAIDALETTGGLVTLDPGTYEIDAPVMLRSNIALIGSGDETVLRKSKGVQTRYIVDADFGELKLTVEDPEGFSIGMKVQVTDDEQNSCWNVSTAYITAIEGNILYIDRGLIRDYRSDLNGLVSNTCSVIDVIQAEQASVSDLVIDGNRNENFFADGCNSAGILMYRSERITVDGVRIRDFNGEGISWQTTENVTIRNSEISGCGNTGLHPGTGSPFSVIENNDVHHNDRDGLFICWRVYQGTVRGNSFHHNGRYGICTGHKDTDVLFEENHIFSNMSDGINLRPERAPNAPHRNTFIRNVIENNGAGGKGYGFSIESPAEDLVLKENIFRNTTGTQQAAIFVYRSGLAPVLENNSFDRHPLGELVFEK
jgi:hypothetical protein